MSLLTTTIAEGRLKAETLGRLYALPGEQADLDRDLATAEALVNSYVGKRAALPVTDADAIIVLREHALSIFAQIAWRRSQSQTVPEKVADASDAAIAWLKDYAKGLVTLAGADLPPPDNGIEGAIIIEGEDPVFNRANMQGI
jgi:phage gp36-like protein